MSKFNHKILAAAVALGITGVAGAAEVQTNVNTAGDYVHAREVTGATTANRKAANGGPISYVVKQGDNVVLRNQAIKVTVKVTGAKFAAGGLAVTAAQGTVAGVTVAANGASATFTVTPAANAVIGTGALFNILAGGAQFEGIPTTEGGSIKFDVTLSDPTTDGELDKASGTVLTVKQATDIDVAANKQPTKIDVGAATGSRTTFAGGVYFVDLGVVSPYLNEFDAAGTVASVAGSGSANDDGAGKFAFDAANDTVELTLTAGNATAFTARTGSAIPANPRNNANTKLYVIPAYLAGVANNCSNFAGATAPAGGELLVADETNANLFTASVPLNAANQDGLRVCAIANGLDPIETQTFSISSQIKLADTSTARQPEAVVGNLATLTYNGQSVNVYHFNPASNADQQSYLRISNTSAVNGLVRISGVDDAAKKGAAVASFTLPAGKSILVTSGDVENGNAAKGIATGIGAPTQGKWRLTVDSEIPSLQVQNFLRNTTSAGMINTNVNNSN